MAKKAVKKAVKKAAPKAAKKKASKVERYVTLYYHSTETGMWHWRIVSRSNGRTILSSESNGIVNKQDLLDTMKPICKALGTKPIDTTESE